MLVSSSIVTGDLHVNPEEFVESSYSTKQELANKQIDSLFSSKSVGGSGAA